MPTIAARSYAVARLQAGQAIRIINTSGSQVVDTWALPIPPRANFPPTCPWYIRGRRRPMLTMLEDTSPGEHDVMFAACSRERYVQLGASPDHDSCANNLYSAVKACDDAAFDKLVEFLECGWMPDPLNLFMKVVVRGSKVGQFETPEPGGGLCRLAGRAGLPCVYECLSHGPY
ncbi:uncharacterized protein MAM_04597 [Metarhizium album ARSEF 1941]|uniref:DUF1989 domain-containing protein n=1 Tax=Metarhizium album (strain ARSEF 1941) TaxID=1081103 RepID=A0A0B2WVU4_METAS|nr:uncharacterized protein MAM_04597 [Metarhizium album ARSEF 1941]KHN97582.1 hypothetical protein MAM_04597 [Metarhizium album ARSEF 1941]